MSECADCQDKDIKIVELHRQIEELQTNLQTIRGALENAHADPDMQIAVLDAIRSLVVDRLRQKYLRAGALSREEVG
jgi:hypothetical protein